MRRLEFLFLGLTLSTNDLGNGCLVSIIIIKGWICNESDMLSASSDVGL
jgi:hypothetical protein